MTERERLRQMVETLPEEAIDGETAARLDAALAEGGEAVPLEEVKRRYRL